MGRVFVQQSLSEVEDKKIYFLSDELVAKPIHLDTLKPHVFSENPNWKTEPHVTSALVHADRLVLGLNTGVIHDINVADRTSNIIDRFVFSEEQKLWDCYGGKYGYEEAMEQKQRIAELLPKLPPETRANFERQFEAGFPLFTGYDGMFRGFREINGLAAHEGVIYDASTRGVFGTNSGKRFSDDSASSLTTYNGKLVFVPTIRGIDAHLVEKREPGKTLFAKEIGSLVEVFSGKVISPDLTPFDGSGYEQGKYAILGDYAYVHHGDWPGECITRTKIGSPTSESKMQVRIPTSNGFIAHKGEMYHIWNHHEERKLVPWNWSPEDDKSCAEPLYSSNEYISVVSDQKNLWIAESDKTNAVTQIGKLVDGKIKTVVEMPGYVRLIAADK